MAALLVAGTARADPPTTTPTTNPADDAAALPAGVEINPSPVAPRFSAAVDEVGRLTRLGLSDRAYLA